MTRADLVWAAAFVAAWRDHERTRFRYDVDAEGRSSAYPLTDREIGDMSARDADRCVAVLLEALPEADT